MLKYFFVGALALFLGSCEDDEENITVTLQDNIERGAVLRTIDFSDEMLLCAGPLEFSMELEEQDIEEGALLDNVNVYVTFTDNSDIAGNTAAFNTGEVLLDNVTAAEFAPGPFGLPRVTLTYSLDELVAAVGGSSDEIYVGDTFLFREELILTDGRIFSVDNAGGIITGGFFNSPFQHVQTVTGGLDLAIDGVNSVNIASGGGDYEATIQVTEAAPDLWADGEVFVSYSVAGSEDNSEGVSVATFTRADFTQSVDDDGNDIANTLENDFMFDFATLSGAVGLSISDMAEGDAINIRYSFNNSCGQAISSFDEPFTDVMPVINCPVLPLSDLSTFVGTYVTTQIAPTIFGYTTFGDGVEVTFVSEGAVDILSGDPVTLTATQRAFDANYLNDLGPGSVPLQTYIADFNCQNVTLVEDAAPIGNFTGWQCSGPSIFGAPDPAGGGPFDVDDDTMFTIAFAEDVLGSCGDPLSNIASIQFDKQ